MLLVRLLNACHHFAGFVYAAVRLVQATSTTRVDVRPRRGPKQHCSCCGKTAPGYDVLAARRFEFIPIWGYAVMLLYAVRRVQCRQCGELVESVPWAKRQAQSDQGLHAVPGALGAQAVVEGDGA